MDRDDAYYKKQILELQAELKRRQEDIESYKAALSGLNQRVQSLIGQLSQDVQTMQLLQKALVPTEMPNIPGFELSTKYQAGTAPGGDYFDIFEQGDRSRFAIVAGTSSDYTTSALLLASLLGVTGKTAQLTEPGHLVENLAKDLSSKFKEGVSADLFYASFDRRDYNLSYILLGGIRAFYQDHETGALKSLLSDPNSLARGFEGRLKTQK